MPTRSPCEPTPLGHAMREQFSFAPGYRNLNHGSFGTSPIAIRNKANELRDECEATPCPFIKYRFPELLDASRAAMSRFLGVAESTVVFVPNATTGVNTVLRNMVWSSDGKDEILQLDVIYGLRVRTIGFDYPVEEDEFVSTFRRAIATSRAEGFRPRVAIFDTICSNPGLRLPFEELAAVCRSEKVLSLIDGAHGVGQIDLDLTSLDPDFFVSNCHKWLFTPRGCALFYVPERNQAMMRSTLPTSHGFVGRLPSGPAPSATTGKSEFVTNFEFVGTADNSAFLTVADAIRWRQEVCGGERKIREYCTGLAQRGGRRVADILGTRILDNMSHRLSDCFMVNIALPIAKPTTGRESLVKGKDGADTTVTEWMQQNMIQRYQTFMPVFPFQGSWWVRLSGQVYLEESDFEWAGWTLKELCEELARS
ncbi:Pyridoxal phosphate-dependent transferase major region subdomain 1 [Penicillium chermesinum]|uniref:Pyridoxal phosphate-dependent transferase major region subdomain 1 n=1 Tax=Penicillium chermesinum TaxID=63820 RepID=A0A9W9NNT3_9EURO|nr:Pyridoxal phosphate-dependent transferase major region subdomain 1 [Penicillium chermesinum]KAJ5223241.1 Pyridoxal phosphate-dependent transferase major region subdomain 1 [Penicillium chermesinum]